MIVVEHNQIELDYCTICKGVWFDTVELELLMQSIVVNSQTVLLKAMLICPEMKSAGKKRKCPICSRKMKLINIGDKSEILIDICHKGDGLWFDGGELAQLLQQKEAKLCQPKDSQQVFDFLSEVFKA